MPAAHDPELKATALAKIAMGATASQVAQETGISVNTIRTWKKRLPKDSPVHQSINASVNQIREKYEGALQRVMLAYLDIIETLLDDLKDEHKREYATLKDTADALSAVSSEHFRMVEAIRSTGTVEGGDPIQ